MKNNSFSFILVAVISLAVGFYAGSFYQKSQQQQRFFQFGARGFSSQNQASRFGGGSRPVIGQIIKKEADSITVKTQNGSTRIVFFTDKTNIGKMTKAEISDLKENETVFIVGQENSDGSITAQNIQIGQISWRRRGN
jgi:hypothetical protein